MPFPISYSFTLSVARPGKVHLTGEQLVALFNRVLEQNGTQLLPTTTDPGFIEGEGRAEIAPRDRGWPTGHIWLECEREGGALAATLTVEMHVAFVVHAILWGALAAWNVPGPVAIHGVLGLLTSTAVAYIPWAYFRGKVEHWFVRFCADLDDELTAV